MSDGDLLLNAILANPDDDTPRLVYADWLQENGQEQRAEFIRGEIWLTRNPVRGAHNLSEFVRAMNGAGLPRVDEVRAAWSQEFGGFMLLTDRGFISSGIWSAEMWLKYADAVLAAHPVTKVRLTAVPLREELRRKGKPGYAVFTTAEGVANWFAGQWPGITFEWPR